MQLRRKVLIAFGLAALATPFAPSAQQPVKVYRVGWLVGGPSSADRDFSFVQQGVLNQYCHRLHFERAHPKDS